MLSCLFTVILWVLRKLEMFVMVIYEKGGREQHGVVTSSIRLHRDKLLVGLSNKILWNLHCLCLALIHSFLHVHRLKKGNPICPKGISM